MMLAFTLIYLVLELHYSIIADRVIRSRNDASIS